MASWTHWRKIADHEFWSSDAFDWDGPSCYELAIGGPRGGKMEVMYVGETGNERRRMSTYAANGSHIAHLINAHLAKGGHLYYRGQLKQTKEAAVQLQNSLLSQFSYPWNTQRNRK